MVGGGGQWEGTMVVLTRGGTSYSGLVGCSAAVAVAAVTAVILYLT